MKSIFVSLLSVLFVQVATSQTYIQGSIQKGQIGNSIDVVCRPNYTSRPDEYVNYLSVSLAIPLGLTTESVPIITGKGCFDKLRFEPAIPFSYIKDGERIYSWICLNQEYKKMSWIKGKPFVGATVDFGGLTKASEINHVRLIDLEKADGGENGNSFFVVCTNQYKEADEGASLFYSIDGFDGGKTGRFNNSDEFVELNWKSSKTPERIAKVLPQKDDAPEFKSLFPNPAQKNINIAMSVVKREKMTLYITDLGGKIVRGETVNLEAGSNIINVDVARLASGMYVVKVMGDSPDLAKIFKFYKE